MKSLFNNDLGLVLLSCVAHVLRVDKIGRVIILFYLQTHCAVAIHRHIIRIKSIVLTSRKITISILLLPFLIEIILFSPNYSILLFSLLTHLSLTCFRRIKYVMTIPTSSTIKMRRIIASKLNEFDLGGRTVGV